MSKKSAVAIEPFVLSEHCTTIFNDLALELPAGVPVQIPLQHLERVLAEPGVVQVFPEEKES
jgi:hypothetical protein